MGIKCYTEFSIPNCDQYSNTLLELNKDPSNFAFITGSDEEQHYMKFLSKDNVKKHLSSLDDYFVSLGTPIEFIILFGVPYNTDPTHGIHKDGYPIENMFSASDTTINFSIKNDQESFLVFFDEDQKEITRTNYSSCPILFRTDIYHTVINHSKNIRITASIRFKQSLQKYLVD